MAVLLEAISIIIRINTIEENIREVGMLSLKMLPIEHCVQTAK